MIRSAPAVPPRVSANQSPKSFPLLPGVKLWWYSSNPPTAEQNAIEMMKSDRNVNAGHFKPPKKADKTPPAIK